MKKRNLLHQQRVGLVFVIPKELRILQSDTVNVSDPLFTRQIWLKMSALRKNWVFFICRVSKTWIFRLQRIFFHKRTSWEYFIFIRRNGKWKNGNNRWLRGQTNLNEEMERQSANWRAEERPHKKTQTNECIAQFWASLLLFYKGIFCSDTILWQFEAITMLIFQSFFLYGCQTSNFFVQSWNKLRPFNGRLSSQHDVY